MRHDENICTDIHNRLTLYVLHDLDETTASVIRKHLDRCPDCRAMEQKVRMTLDSLQDALSSSQPAPSPLSSSQHQSIQAGMQRGKPATPTHRRNRSNWQRILWSVPMKLAASFIIGVALISLMMPAGKLRSPSIDRSVAVGIIDLEYARHGAELSDHNGRSSPIGYGSGRAELSEDDRFDAMEDAILGDVYGRMNEYLAVPERVEVAFSPDPALPRPATHPASPRPESSPAPADFDSVAITKSPVTMRGLTASRSPGAREGRQQAMSGPQFKAADVNPIVETRSAPFSTFSIDVDTASYTIARNFMLRGSLPPPEAVRTEEFVNYFDYAYPPPVADVFRITTAVAPSRFGRGMHLIKVGIKGRREGREQQRPAALTLLVDTSGSMNRPDRIGLTRHALEMLIDALGPHDQVALIQFDSQARLLLSHTAVSQKETILEVIHALQCGGGTNLEAGMRLAFEQAARGFVSRGENRILLISDGVATLGEAAADVIMAQVEQFRRQGLYLSVFGVGMETYDDEMLKTLASKGNGAYAFLDSEAEARRVFVDDLSATLNTIAEDVKIQVEFNPQQVTTYRQLGYERRQLTREQFRDDRVDAGEIGSGQAVTALYEVSLSAPPETRPAPSPYVHNHRDSGAWLARVRVRYRNQESGRIEEIEQRVFFHDVLPTFEDADTRFRLAAGVAAFAELLRGSPYVQGVEFSDVAAVLRPVALELNLDSRVQEMMRIIETAAGLPRRYE